MKQLDDRFMDHLERFVHRFQRQTGFDCFWLTHASWNLFSLSVFLVFLFAEGVEVGLTIRLPVSVMAAAIPMIIGLRFMKEINPVRDHYATGSTSAHRVTQACRELWWFRWGLLCSFVFVGFQWDINLNAVMYTLFMILWSSLPFTLFFMAITPLPPAQQFETKLVPAPIPVR